MLRFAQFFASSKATKLVRQEDNGSEQSLCILPYHMYAFLYRYIHVKTHLFLSLYRYVCPREGFSEEEINDLAASFTTWKEEEEEEWKRVGG